MGMFEENIIVVNDFIIPSRAPEGAEHRGRHFKIWFDPLKKAYFIKDLGVGF